MKKPSTVYPSTLSVIKEIFVTDNSCVLKVCDTEGISAKFTSNNSILVSHEGKKEVIHLVDVEFNNKLTRNVEIII